jgi:anaphase-promoting complex subunit 1
LVRSNKTCGEEELYFSGKVAVHCKGHQNTRVLEATYTCETDVKHALWCTFHTSIPNHWNKNKEQEDQQTTGKSIECICLLDTYTLKVFTENGEDYVAALQFQVGLLK